jgi:type II secretory pathway predicted ATPase ExeA
MYKHYFGLRTLPFSITPDPRFFYDNPSYREAFASLRYGVERRKGFIVITGEAGTGKTTLVKAFRQSAEVKIHTVFIINPKLSSTELLRFILNDFGIAPSTQDRGTLILQLNEYLFEQFKKGKIVTLLVDEAQHLSNDLLEELRLLSNLETNEDKLIQIVLVGQPELEERLDQPELRQLKQRVTLRCRLAPLKDQEVDCYIQARLRTAGFEREALFDPKAIEKIALYAKGIPRLINVICDNALLTCYALSRQTVSAEIIEEVARDLQLTKRPPIEKPHTPIESETPNQPYATENEPRITKEAGPSTSVSQTRPPDLPNLFIGGERRRTRSGRRRRPTDSRTALVFAVVAGAGLGAIFFAHSNKNDVSGIAARIWDENSGRASLQTAAVEPEALHENPSKKLDDHQALLSDKAPVSTQQPAARGAGASTMPILEANKTGPSRPADSSERSEEKQTIKNNKKDQTITTDAKGTNQKRFGVVRASTNDRLEFDIHKALATRAITGVAVSVIDGTVVLGGRVATENQKFAAAQAVRSVPGVRNVHNQILVNDGLASRSSEDPVAKIYSKSQDDQT